MTARSGAMHVARNKRSYVAKSGERRVYESVLVRRTYREGGKVRHETLANLSALPAEAVAAIEATLRGERLVPAGQAVAITGSLPHGHVAAVHAMAAKLGLPALLGPAGRARDLALALVISRVVRPGSKLATLAWWGDTTLGADLGVAGASTDDIYAAMDWLVHRQDAIEAGLARRHLGPAANPARMALFDLSSSWLEGSQCPLAARGYSRDGKKGRLQIEYGLLTDPAGRPVAVRAFPGNTGDPAAFTEIVQVVRERFGLAQMVMVGDRGMITSARIAALNRLEDGTARPDPYGWITALRAPAIKKLMADDGPLQLSLFDEQDLAEIVSGDFPGERLVACRNPVLAAERARKREDLLQATEKLLAPIAARVTAGRLAGAAAIGVEVGKVISKYKTGKHFEVTITDDSLTVARRQAQIDAEAALDGFYVLRTPIPAAQLDGPAVVTACKNLKYVERDFRCESGDGHQAGDAPSQGPDHPGGGCGPPCGSGSLACCEFHGWVSGPMIARIWRGWTRSWDADAYARYLMATTIPQCRAAQGNRAAYLLRRGDGDRMEFVTITLWDSLAAMRAFTGENGEQPPLSADDARFLIGGGPAVVLYETIDRPG